MDISGQIRSYLDSLAKPPGSLGRLEHLAEQLATIQQTLHPRTQPRRLVLFAADHGVVAEGVTAWPQAITQLVMQTVLAGKAASSVLAQSTQTDWLLVDIGTVGPELPPQRRLLNHRVRPGTANLLLEAAMTATEFDQAWNIGAEQARQALQNSIQLAAVGELGIGNTTSASCLAVLLAGLNIQQAVGPGAGATEAILHRKRQVVTQAVSRVQALPIRSAITSVAGLEIVAMAGFLAQAAQVRLPVVLDGFIATAAALIAERLQPGSRSCWLAAHRSAEPGHAGMLEHLQLKPYLDGWNLRLGEGTGALLLLPLLDAAAAMMNQMATLADLGVGS